LLECGLLLFSNFLEVKLASDEAYLSAYLFYFLEGPLELSLSSFYNVLPKPPTVFVSMEFPASRG